MGLFDKDNSGKIKLLPGDYQDTYIDKNDRSVNKKGYLIDADGNIIDR